MDHSANEIYHTQVKDMVAALHRCDHKEAADRALAIQTLWYSAGRASEPGYLAYEGLRWNTLHSCAVIESFQSKPSKLKFVPFLAAPDRHSDWMLSYGDHLVFDHGQTRYSDGEQGKNWLLPELGGTSGAGTKLSSYIKGLQPEGRPGAQAKYFKGKGGAVASLPPQPTAAGLRPGAADTLACAVPAELGVHNTGHDLTGLSALWEYLQARVALTIPGMVALVGWPPITYGHLGKGPEPPQLSAVIGVSIESFDKMIDHLFTFHLEGGRHPPMLLVGGELRPLMHATLATMIMYYHDRFLK